jgi:hypothetical protein
MGRDRAASDPRSFDRFATDYDRYVSMEPAGLPGWLLDHLPRRRGRVLDAGCGSAAAPWRWPNGSTRWWAST